MNLRVEMLRFAHEQLSCFDRPLVAALDAQDTPDGVLHIDVRVNR